jgi:hypothetical protein
MFVGLFWAFIYYLEKPFRRMIGWKLGIEGNGQLANSSTEFWPIFFLPIPQGMDILRGQNIFGMEKK